VHENIQNVGNVPIIIKISKQENSPEMKIGEHIVNQSLILEDEINVGESYYIPIWINTSNISQGNYTYKLHVQAQHT